MPDLEFLVWRRRFGPVLRRVFGKTVAAKAATATVAKLAKSIEVRPE